MTEYGPLLSTKFYPPRHRSGHIPRDRLVAQLNAGLDQKVTLLSAPAGYGKTTLLGQWLPQCGRPAAWLSVDKRDDDAQRFLRYVAAALVQVQGMQPLQTLVPPGGYDPHTLLIRLVNQIASTSTPFILVLDDFHNIQGGTVHESLLYLIDHMPLQMHLVISTRADPPWPLSRLRANGNIREIRAPDLRCTLEESSSYIRSTLGLEIPREDLEALDSRVEGWIAGLQLAALSLRDRTDQSAFLRAFTGSHRYVMDYLLEEVLNRQKPATRQFLLETSILDRVSAGLCDAVLDTTGSQSTLMDLDSRNLFLVRLDDDRRWYRYHHLFRDLLRSHLQRVNARNIPELHQRASLWYEQNGLMADALSHALAADDVERIVHLTAGLAVGSMDHGEMNALYAWLAHADESALNARPWLQIAAAWSAFHRGQYAEVEQILASLEEKLSIDSIPEEDPARIRGHSAAIRSYLVELSSDPLTAVRQAKDALALLSEEDRRLRGFIEIRMANSLMGLGRLEAAARAYRSAAESGRREGDVSSVIIARAELALVLMLQGHLQEAIRHVQETIADADRLARLEGRRSPATGVLLRHLSTIQREANKLAEAGQSAEEALKICEEWGEKEALLFARLASARVLFSRGAFEAAEEQFSSVLLQAARISTHYEKLFQAHILYYRLLAGLPEEAERWVRERGLSPGDTISYERHMEYQVLARFLRAKGDLSGALAVVDALLALFTESGAGMYVFRQLVHRALILEALDQPEAASKSFEKALEPASRERFVRLFLDEGDAVAPLLRRAAARGVGVEFSAELSARLAEERPTPSATGIPDPLTARELEVLRLLALDIRTPVIAKELFVSTSTIRSHVKRIYAKLGAHSRLEALLKARENNLL